MDATLVRGWDDQLQTRLASIGPHFSRSDLRQRACHYVRGLLGPVRRKNGWQLAEYVGDATPDAVLALAFLAAVRAKAEESESGKKGVLIWSR